MPCFHGSTNLGASFCIRSTRGAAEAKETESGDAMKEATSDPRQPSTAKPYVSATLSPQDLPIDYAGFLAVVFGVVGVTLRYKLCSWLAIIFCAQSLANMKNFENDFKQLSMAFMFGIMGLVTNYLGPSRQANKQR
ncbi:protein Asterix-like [Musa acuminata AAA Group]|uniref:protein Asterix n=1 Tax=Musa acuminata AAA Group TaxID=214697 RepID=UPI0031D2FE58